MIARAAIPAVSVLLMFTPAGMGADKGPLTMKEAIVCAVDLSSGLHVFNRGRTEDKSRVYYERVLVHGIPESEGRLKVVFGFFPEGHPKTPPPHAFEFSPSGEPTVPAAPDSLPPGVVRTDEYRIRGAVKAALANYLDGHDAAGAAKVRRESGAVKYLREDEVALWLSVSLVERDVRIHIQEALVFGEWMVIVVNDKNEVERRILGL